MSASLILRAWHTPWTQLLRGTICDALPVDEAVAAARLPACLSSLALQTARSTRLWPGEQADVARELAAHFEDGLAAGIDARTLVESFGPSAAAARLIRRAKKRARPMSLKALDRLRQMLMVSTAITMATLAGFAARAWMGQPKVTHSRVFAIEAKLRATTTRSWPALREAFLMLPSIEVKLHDAAEHLMPEHEGWQFAREYLRQGSPVLPRIRACATHDRAGVPVKTSYDAAIGNKLSRRFEAGAGDAAAPIDASATRTWPGNAAASVMGECGTLLTFAALDALHAGDASEFRSILRDWLRLAEQFQGPSKLEDQVVGFQEFERICRVVGRVLNSAECRKLPSEDLHDIAAMLRSWNAGGTTLDLSMQHAAFRDWMQQMYTDDGTGDGHILGNQILEQYRWEPASSRLLGIMLAPTLTISRKQAVELHQTLIEDAHRATSVPVLDHRVREASRDRAAAREDSLASVRHWPALMLIPHNLESLLLAPRHAMLQRDGILLAIAAELVRRDTGVFPSSLDTIAPHIPGCSTRDPFDGLPLRYTIRDGRPLIYSIGSDRSDNHGAPPHHLTDNLLHGAESQQPGDWILYPISIHRHLVEQIEPSTHAPGDHVCTGTRDAV